MKVAIVILHYKNIKDTINCLHSISKLESEEFVLKVILVINGSKIKNQKSKIKNINKNLKIIENEKNLGFAAGVNVGIRRALKDKKTEYVLILNNDTILPKNLLQVLLKQNLQSQCHSEFISESHGIPDQVRDDRRRVDISSPVIKFKSLEGKWVYDYGGKVNWWIGKTKHIEKLSVVSCQLSEALDEVDYVSGCCMLVRREVFEKIGLFDEDYFFYFEDVDFCIRARKAGFEVSINPQVAVFHKLGGSIGRWTRQAIGRNLWGNFLFISKNLGWRRPVGYVYLFLLSCKIFFNYLRGRQ